MRLCGPSTTENPHGYISRFPGFWLLMAQIAKIAAGGIDTIQAPADHPTDEPLLDLGNRGRPGSGRLLCCFVLRHLDLMVVPAFLPRLLPFHHGKQPVPVTAFGSPPTPASHEALINAPAELAIARVLKNCA
jgi:hypothetical protein